MKRMSSCSTRFTTRVNASKRDNCRLERDEVSRPPAPIFRVLHAPKPGPDQDNAIVLGGQGCIGLSAANKRSYSERLVYDQRLKKP